MAALQRRDRHAAGKTPRHADPVAEALVEGRRSGILQPAACTTRPGLRASSSSEAPCC